MFRYPTITQRVSHPSHICSGIVSRKDWHSPAAAVTVDPSRVGQQHHVLAAAGDGLHPLPRRRRHPLQCQQAAPCRRRRSHHTARHYCTQQRPLRYALSGRKEEYSQVTAGEVTSLNCLTYFIKQNIKVSAKKMGDECRRTDSEDNLDNISKRIWVPQ